MYGAQVSLKKIDDSKIAPLVLHTCAESPPPSQPPSTTECWHLSALHYGSSFIEIRRYKNPEKNVFQESDYIPVNIDKGLPECENSSVTGRLNDDILVVFRAWKDGATTGLRFTFKDPNDSNLVVSTSRVDYMVSVKVLNVSPIEGIFKYSHPLSFTVYDREGHNATCTVNVIINTNEPPMAYPQYEPLRARIIKNKPTPVTVELHANDPEHNVLQYIIRAVPKTGTLYQPSKFLRDNYESMRGTPRGLVSFENRSIVVGGIVETGDVYTKYAVLVYQPEAAEGKQDSLKFQVFDGIDYSNVVTIPLIVMPNTPPTCSDQVITVKAGKQVDFQPNATDPDPGDTLKITLMTPPSKGYIQTRKADTLDSDTPWTQVSNPDDRIWEYSRYRSYYKDVDSEEKFTYMATDLSGDEAVRDWSL
jgi:hypothetical protein